jgi:hypothetical protein
VDAGEIAYGVSDGDVGERAKKTMKKRRTFVCSRTGIP